MPMLMVRALTLTLVEEQYSENKEKNNMLDKVCMEIVMSASISNFALKMMEALRIL